MLALSHLLILYPTLRPNVQWLGPVVTRFETNANEAWLTIDDGPTDDTLAVLDLLERYRVKATFFVKGKLVEKHPELAKAIMERGHTIANHSHTHPSASFWCALPRQVATQIDECNRVLETMSREKPRWFRAPVGHKNPAVHPALSRRGMRLIGWSARGFDGVAKDTDRIAERILSRVRPGAIILLHQGREHSLIAIERVLAALQERGYACVIPRDEQLR